MSNNRTSDRPKISLEFRRRKGPDSPHFGRSIPPFILQVLVITIVAAFGASGSKADQAAGESSSRDAAAPAFSARAGKDADKKKEEGRKVFAPGKQASPKDASKDAQARDPASRAWSIVVESHIGKSALADAQARLAPISDALNRKDVFVRATERGAAIVVGLYEAPDAPQVREDLTTIRNTAIGQSLPFASAFLAPPPEVSDPGQLPELNLEAATKSYGARAQYTLQIAVYESAKRDEAKRAAEQAALQLRRDGELAFYYHGPNRSSVTLGVFSDNDFDAGLRPKSPSLIALQQRYPLNLHNGQYPIVEKRPGEVDRKQPSMLVRIP
jgi:hypothetical protein